MKLLSIHTLVIAMYAAAVASYAWSEHDPLLVLVGVSPMLLLMLVRAFDRSGNFEWSIKTPTSN